MAQHILLSARYRDLPIGEIARLSENEAHAIMRLARWPETDGEPICPECGCEAWTLGGHDVPEAARQFKCKGCRDKFTVTSGTLLHSRKLPFWKILMAVKLFSMGAKGLQATIMNGETPMAYKSAFVMGHKLREGQIIRQLGRKLTGIVEIDGTYLGGHQHQPNEKSEWVDRRKTGDVTGKRMAIVVARERSSRDYIGKAICGVFKHEADGRPMIYEGVDRMATVYADEASHWDAMHGVFNTGRVNHSKRFYDKGVCTNQSESLFSRVDKMAGGTHHHIAGDYLWGYAADALWREEMRRSTQGEKFDVALRLLLGNKVSRTMCGYWQRHLVVTRPLLDAPSPDLPTMLAELGLHDDHDARADDADGDLDQTDLFAAPEDEEPDRGDVERPVGDEGRMSREDAIKAFGVDAVGGSSTGVKPIGRKRRKAFAPKPPALRPLPWSEFLRPASLPSMDP